MPDGSRSADLVVIAGERNREWTEGRVSDEIRVRGVKVPPQEPMRRLSRVPARAAASTHVYHLSLEVL